MKAAAVALLIAALLPGARAAEPAVPAAPPPLFLFPLYSLPTGLPPALLPDSVVERAVQQALAETPPAERGQVLARANVDAFERAFDNARMPGCLKPDGLKWQPPMLGPFTVHGLRAAFPFVIVAKWRGKCT